MNIPVIMMFDDSYVIPASVAIYSLLKNAVRQHFYDLRIMYTNISEKHKNKLIEMLDGFSNASIKFFNMKEYNTKLDIPDTISGWPREIIYKLIIADIFTDIDRAIVTDVDVVFVGDVSQEFIKFKTDEYIAMVKNSTLPHDKPFSLDITDNNIHFMYGAGYMIYNTKAMRRDKMPKKYIDFMHKNLQYLRFPDQEILNIVNYPNIKPLHPRNMALVSWWRLKDFVFNKYDYNSSEKEHLESLEKPIQIHYVTWTTWAKPWKDINAPLANLWYRYLTYTNFFTEFFITKNKKHQKRFLWW